MDIDLAPARPPTSARVVALLVALFAARGVVLLCVLPPGEMWDEYSHLAVVDHWAATGRPATYNRTAADPAFLAALVRLPQPPPVAFGRGYADFWAGRPDVRPVHSPALIYEAQHPPLYYALAAPLYRACGGRDDLPAAVAALRAVNLACGTAALLLVLRWLHRTLPPPAAVVVGTWVALQPLQLLNVVRVANDPLAFLLGTAVVVGSLDLRRGRFWPRLIALAVLLPLSIQTKATNATLLPVVAVAVLIARRPAGLLVVAAVTAAALGPSVASNLHTFGVVTPMQEAVVNRAAGRSAWAVLAAAPPWRWPTWAASWWAVDGLWVGGWSFLQPPVPLKAAYAALIAIATTAAAVRWRSLPLPPLTRWTVTLVVASAHLGLMVHAAESAAAWDGRVSTNPWYAAVALPWALALLGCGGLSIPRAVRPWVTLGVPAVFVAAEGVGLARMVAAYAAAPVSLSAVRRLATLRPVVLGPATFAAAMMGVIVLLVAAVRAGLTAAACGLANQGPPAVAPCGPRTGPDAVSR